MSVVLFRLQMVMLPRRHNNNKARLVASGNSGQVLHFSGDIRMVEVQDSEPVYVKSTPNAAAPSEPRRSLTHLEPFLASCSHRSNSKQVGKVASAVLPIEDNLR